MKVQSMFGRIFRQKETQIHLQVASDYILVEYYWSSAQKSGDANLVTQLLGQQESHILRKGRKGEWPRDPLVQNKIESK